MTEKIIQYQDLIKKLPTLIANSPFKKNYIIKEIGMPQPTFYRKLKNQTFTVSEMMAIAKILEPEKTYLLELKKSIKRGKKEVKEGNYHKHSEVIEELKELLK